MLWTIVAGTSVGVRIVIAMARSITRVWRIVVRLIGGGGGGWGGAGGRIGRW